VPLLPLEINAAVLAGQVARYCPDIVGWRSPTAPIA
jgi:hypothetical protein